MKFEDEIDNYEDLQNVEYYLILYALANEYDPFDDIPISIDDIIIDNKVYKGRKLNEKSSNTIKKLC